MKRVELKAEIEALAEAKRLAKFGKEVVAKHPLEVKRNRVSSSSRQRKPQDEVSYEGLEGEWLGWYQVAKRYEVKVPYQDRADIRHTIILELALARAKTQEPIPLYRAYRIASYMVADYYRQQRKLNTGLDCQHCSKAQRSKCKEGELYRQCPKLIRLEYLESEHLDSEGNIVTIQDTLSDDRAIDLDAWLDAGIWLQGCQIRLIEIAHKIRQGLDLTESEKNHLYHYRNRELKKTQKSLF